MASGTGHSRRVVGVVSLGAGLVVLAIAGAAQAHQVGLSRGVYAVRGAAVQAELTFARGELRTLAPTLDGDGDGALSEAELAGGAAALQAALIDQVVVTGDGQACAGTVTR